MRVDYTNQLHNKSAERTKSSALTIVPIIYDLLHPRSVVDVGCGHGYWLKEFMARGVDDTLGVDGDYVLRSDIAIPSSFFKAADLNTPLNLSRRFDIAMTVEVAEHLKPSSSDHFVESLCGLSDQILFSAAVPGQPGHRHINARWPDFWAEKFQKHGYVGFDFIRPQIWHLEEVMLCHRQNILMYVSRERAESLPWNGLPRSNSLTLIDLDTLKHLLGPRMSLLRAVRTLVGRRRD
jgi:SAM-dependent methyltransferase